MLRRTVLCLGILVISFIAHGQSPWIKDYKEKYIEVGFNTIPTYQKVFQGNRQQIKEIDGTILEIGTKVYLEYGLGKRFQVQGSLPFSYVSSTVTDSNKIRDSGNLLGLGNLEVGLKYQILSHPLLTGQFLIGLPNKGKDSSKGLRTGYNSFYFIPTFSTGNSGEKWYYYAHAGFGIYSNKLSDDIRFGIEYGHNVFSNFWVMLSLNLRESLKNSQFEESAAFGETYLYVNNQSYSSFALKLSYEVKEDIGINLGVNLISVRANNLPFQRPFNLSIYKKW